MSVLIIDRPQSCSPPCSLPLQFSYPEMACVSHVHRGAGPEHGPRDLGLLPLLSEADSGAHFIFKKTFIYLAVLGPSCSTWDLWLLRANS